MRKAACEVEAASVPRDTDNVCARRAHIQHSMRHQHLPSPARPLPKSTGPTHTFRTQKRNTASRKKDEPHPEKRTSVNPLPEERPSRCHNGRRKAHVEKHMLSFRSLIVNEA
ncbi:hypothetical protein NDU88_010980 [Pleurodeles waltl]|uniref:Uncharacterized protein n=1 Tax=Pleurodeles waltl TaxID=8319 RepID=A0AAV7S2S1_PLEWA|nr:hypothetical protein NDU88_010980 [Pleurodeles waltl]